MCYVGYRTQGASGVPSIAPAESAPAVVAIGMSAGGLRPLCEIVAGLARPFPAAVVIAHHVGAISALPSLLRGSGHPSVTFGAEGTVLVEDSITVCPPGQHTVVNPDGTFGVSSIERIGFVRPSIDWLFESMA